jgi:hypothetical protein
VRLSLELERVAGQRKAALMARQRSAVRGGEQCASEVNSKVCASAECRGEYRVWQRLGALDHGSSRSREPPYGSDWPSELEPHTRVGRGARKCEGSAPSLKYATSDGLHARTRSICCALASALMGCHSGEPFDLSVRVLPAADVGFTRDAGNEPTGSEPQFDAGNQSTGSRPQFDAGNESTGSRPQFDAGSESTDSSGPALHSTRSLGAACERATDCESQQCANNVCCNRPCDGQCEGCSSSGVCAVLAECAFASCNGDICVPVRAPLGSQCSGKGQCESGFCVDGVCCENACADVCQNCGSSGFCNVFPLADQQCPVLVCPPDTTCRQYFPPLAGNCGGFGRCASPTDCATFDALAGTYCGPDQRCDGSGACVPEAPGVGSVGPVAECFRQGTFDNAAFSCVNEATGHELVQGRGVDMPYKFLQADLSILTLEIGMFGFDANDQPIDDCALIESATGRHVTVEGACDNAVWWTLYGNE